MYRNCLFLIMLFTGVMLVVNTTQAQENDASSAVPTKRIFMGIESGLNSKVGLFGAKLQAGITPQIMLGVGGGIGTWGYKYSGYGRYYFNQEYRGSYVHLGYSVASGISDVDLEVETIDASTGIVDMREANMKLHSVGLVDFGYGYAGKVGENSRIYFQTGLSLRTVAAKDTYEIRSDELILSDTGESLMQLLSPGGLIVALGFDFGL